MRLNSFPRAKGLVLTLTAALALCSAPAVPRAEAAIQVVSQVSQTISDLEAIRAQAVISEPTSRDRGSTFTAVSIKEITASMLFRDEGIANGIQVNKSNLTQAQAYGLDLPFGNTSPPTTDPEGPWHGLVWPYRDQYDYFPNQFDPLGDDVGIPFQDQPGVYGFVNIAGISRGGPTDPEPAGGSPDRLLRGLDGNGLTGPASYFLFDIVPLTGPFDRTIRLKIFGASAIVVQRNNSTGAYSEIQVPIPDFETTIKLPEPGAAASLACAAAALLARRRRAQR